MDAPVHLAQQQRPAIGADHPAVKLGAHLAAKCLANEKLDWLHCVTGGLLVFRGANVFSINVALLGF